MTDNTENASLQTAVSINRFAGRQGDYYSKEFKKIHASSKIVFRFNISAALLGPLWASTRSIWGFFWASTLGLLLASVMLGQGLWGELGADKLAQAERLNIKSEEMAARAEVATEAGDANAEALLRNSQNLENAANRAIDEANEASEGAKNRIILGALLMVFIVVVQGFAANIIYERKYCLWRANSDEQSGFSYNGMAIGAGILGIMFPLVLYRFTSSNPIDWLVTFPVNKNIFNASANWLNTSIDSVALKGAGFFEGITQTIRIILDALEIVLVDTPWPVIVLVILFMSWRLSGPRAAVYTMTALAYLAFFGYWEKSMATISLLGAAATLCIILGVPLGILCAKNKVVNSLTKPALDFMQTMPAFVYLIPIIAFFGTGKPPGVLATIIFGMPPVVRLTTLGIQQVPESIVEGALAFGCSRWKLLWDVEIPLAKSSIMAGINQTILMCLSMVVIASLIGAEGLGTDVLQALQFAAKGQGLLAGLAILFCAIMIDRIVQGYFKSTAGKTNNGD